MKYLILLSFLLSPIVAQNVCPNYVSLTDPSVCIGKCCNGQCQAASCDGNTIARSEKECVVTNTKLNNGANCPWKTSTYGVYCNYVNPSCQPNKGNNCYGQTACGTGTCPLSALGLFCIESGASNNFKVCSCDNVDCVVGDWSDWSACVNNIQTRTREVITSQSGEGTECSVLTQTQSCNSCASAIKTKPDFYVAYFNKQLVGTSVLANDIGVITAELIQNPTKGQLTFNDQGTFVYTPDQNFCGTDSFMYKAWNGQCFSEEEVIITTTCGCGTVVDTVECVLDQSQSTTTCYLTGGQTVTVANKPGYTKAVLTVSTKVSYKKK